MRKKKKKKKRNIGILKLFALRAKMIKFITKADYTGYAQSEIYLQERQKKKKKDFERQYIFSYQCSFSTLDHVCTHTYIYNFITRVYTYTPTVLKHCHFLF